MTSRIRNHLMSPVAEFLNLQTHDEYQDFINTAYFTDQTFSSAYDYVKRVPFDELPKWINHPSRIVKDIVNKRLVGKTNFDH